MSQASVRRASEPAGPDARCALRSVLSSFSSVLSEAWSVASDELTAFARWAEVERTKIEYLEKQSLDAGRRREALGNERSGLDTTA